MSQPFDDSAKQFYRRWFQERGMKVESEVEVFLRSRMIDLVVECSRADQALLKDTIFAYFRLLNLLELKGDEDPLTLEDLNIILMRAWGLGAMEWLKQLPPDLEALGEQPSSLLPYERYQLPSQRTVTIISMTRPTKLLDWLSEELQFQRTEEPGIYFRDGFLAIWIICPWQLRLEPKNYPLLPLSKGKKLEQFIDICLSDGLNHYLQLIIDIGLVTDPNVIWRKLLEATQMRAKIREDTWPVIDRFFQEMPQAFQKLPTFLDALQASERQGIEVGEKRGIEVGEKRGIERGIEKGMEKGIEVGEKRGIEKGIEKGIEVGEKRGIEKGIEKGQQQAAQQMLIRLLRRKFITLPEAVINQIKATTDMQQLQSWLDQVLEAKALEEMDFLLPPQNGTAALNGS